MAGMEIIVTKTLENGNIDVEDLREKAIKHAANLSCLMVTYPSTHGVYEASIIEVTKIIHENGGQVYMDGANMNAQVGLTNPATIGADVCHLNLHKTFAIPHGGGGLVLLNLRGKTFGTVFTNESCDSNGRRDTNHRNFGSTLGIGSRVFDFLRIHHHAGRRRPDRCHQIRHPQRELHQRAPHRPL
jgi:hypothetical protein